MVGKSAPIGFTMRTSDFVLGSTVSVMVYHSEIGMHPQCGNMWKHRVMTNHQMGYLDIGKNSLFSWPLGDRLHLASYATDTEQKM